MPAQLIKFSPEHTKDPDYWREDTLWVLEKKGVEYTENADGSIEWYEDNQSPNEELVMNVVLLREAGLSFAQIASIVGVSKACAFRYWNRGKPHEPIP